MTARSSFRDEIRLVLRRASLLDAVVGPLVFAVVNLFAGTRTAVVAGMGSAALVLVWRMVRRGSLTYALGGVGGTLIASALVGFTGRAEDYFLPGILSGAITTLALVVSVIAGRPLVALISSVTRQWPIDWYHHPLVKPAYDLATWLWAGFFAARTALQGYLYLESSVEVLAGVRVATGWPGMLGLLALTYLLGRWRLAALAGPSVEEWEAGSDPPWRGQESGF